MVHIIEWAIFLVPNDNTVIIKWPFMSANGEWNM